VAACAPTTPRRRITDLEALIAVEVAAWLERRGGTDAPQTTAWIIVNAVEALTHRWVIQPGERGDDEAFVRGAARMLAASL
jgi:hypothetical protein